jgi:hypothetical protein
VNTASAVGRVNDELETTLIERSCFVHVIRMNGNEGSKGNDEKLQPQ